MRVIEGNGCNAGMKGEAEECGFRENCGVLGGSTVARGKGETFLFLSLFSLLVRRRVWNNIAGADVFIVVRTYNTFEKVTLLPLLSLPYILP